MGFKNKLIILMLLLIISTCMIIAEDTTESLDFQWFQFLNAIDNKDYISGLDLIDQIESKYHFEEVYQNYIFVLYSLGRNGEVLAIARKGLYYNPNSKFIKNVIKTINDKYYKNIIEMPFYTKVNIKYYILIIFCLNFILVMSIIFKKKEITKIIFLLIFIVFFGFSLFISYPYTCNIGITISNNNLVKFPSNSSEKIFVVKLGTPVKIVYDFEDYYYIRHPEGYTGWIEKKYLKKVF